MQKVLRSQSVTAVRSGRAIEPPPSTRNLFLLLELVASQAMMVNESYTAFSSCVATKVRKVSTTKRLSELTDLGSVTYCTMRKPNKYSTF